MRHRDGEGRINQLSSWIASAPIVVAVLAITACGGSGGASGQTAAKPLTDAELVAKVKPSVIQIYGRLGSSVYSGSGVIIDTSNRWALTNAHVTDGLSSMKARTGEFETPASLVATAPCDDVSLVQLSSLPPGAKAIPFGSSANVVAGQRVEALGYPGSFEDYTQQKLSATAGAVSVDGTVSATPEDDLPTYESVIEHQAPIGHGSSGGPLVDSAGRLLGLNTLGQDVDVTQNQAYAISIDHIKMLLPTLESGSSVAYVGWSLFPAALTSSEDWQSLGWDLDPAGTGMAVLGVDSGSPADRHNFKFGDYVEFIEGTEVRTMQDVCDILKSKRGSVITVNGRVMGGQYGNETYTEKLTVN
jgi:S1-C subfamily serine protease